MRLRATQSTAPCHAMPLTGRLHLSMHLGHLILETPTTLGCPHVESEVLSQIHLLAIPGQWPCLRCENGRAGGGEGVLFNQTSTRQTTAVDGQGRTASQGQRTDWTMRRTRIPASTQEGASVTPPSPPWVALSSQHKRARAAARRRETSSPTNTRPPVGRMPADRPLRSRGCVEQDATTHVRTQQRRDGRCGRLTSPGGPA